MNNEEIIERIDEIYIRATTFKNTLDFAQMSMSDFKGEAGLLLIEDVMFSMVELASALCEKIAAFDNDFHKY